MEDLNALMNRYTAGKLEKKDFEGRIFKFIIDNPRCFHLADWDRGTCIDYLCWLYPRWSKAIEAYKNTGSSFGAYINSIVQWSSKEYCSRELEHGITEYAYWKSWSYDVYEAEPEYFTEKIEKEKNTRILFKAKRKEFANTRQILILLLKSYAFVSDDFIEQVADSINIEVDQLKKWISQIKTIRFKHDEEIQRLKEHIRSQFYRCSSFEWRLKALSPSCAKYETMKECLARGKTRLATMKKRLAGLSVSASNRMVAEVLGLSKGTVDSNLYVVKQKWKEWERKYRE
jgi:DNA-directed RNA polymerase specialized sigma24 family protein